MLESPNTEAKDEESQLVALLCGDVLDGDQGRAQVGICRVKVEMFGTFHPRPGPGVTVRNKTVKVQQKERNIFTRKHRMML